MSWSPEYRDRWEKRRAWYTQEQAKTLLWSQIWVRALRDAGIPLVGQFKEMTPAHYTQGGDEYIFMFGEFSCAHQCMMHTEATPLTHRGTLYVYLGEWAQGLEGIERHPVPQPYCVEYRLTKTDTLKVQGHTPWNSFVVSLRPDDVVNEMYQSITKYGCKHLKPIIELGVEALAPYFLLGSLQLVE